jgi:pimeloyl-ACP methyl ester carboxylesterase
MPTLQSHRVVGRAFNLWVDGSGPPLVYLHGFQSHPGAAGFLRRLAQRHHVVAPEHPGYGTSDGLEQIHDMLDLVLAYRALIESCDLGPVDLVGHSLGGMVAGDLAAICPEVVRRLVLVNAFGLWLDEEPAPDPFGSAEDVLAAAWHDPTFAVDHAPAIVALDPADPQAPTLLRARNLATATKFMWPIADRGLRRRLPLIHARTLVVHGVSDRLVPVSYAAEFARLIPDARLTKIESAGHHPMIEREDEFVSAVERFLAEP